MYERVVVSTTTSMTGRMHSATIFFFRRSTFTYWRGAFEAVKRLVAVPSLAHERNTAKYMWASAPLRSRSREGQIANPVAQHVKLLFCRHGP